MMFNFFKSKKLLPRKGLSAKDKFGTDFLNLPQNQRGEILKNIVEEKGSTLTAGYDYEVLLLICSDIDNSDITVMKETLRKSDVDFSMEYHRTKTYPVLEFQISFPRTSVSIKPINFYIDIADADFQDFVDHLPGSFEFGIFWYSKQDTNFIFMETTGIVGDEFVNQVKDCYNQARKDYWSIPEEKRNYLSALELLTE